MSVFTPLMSNNSGGPTATLADPTPGLLPACNVGTHRYVAGGTPQGAGPQLTYSPHTYYPGDENGPVSVIYNHGIKAVMDVNLGAPSESISYSYSYAENILNPVDQSVYETFKTVWFGTLTVTKLTSQEIPRPVDPFHQRGYQPADPSVPPNEPPAAPNVPTKSIITDWIKSVSDTTKFSIMDLARDLDESTNVYNRAATVTTDRFISYEIKKRLLTIAQSQPAPATGSIVTTLRVKDSSGALFAQQVDSSKSKKVAISSGNPIGLNLQLTPAGAATIKKGSAVTLFLTSKVTNSDPKLVVTHSTKFKVAKRKK